MKKILEKDYYVGLDVGTDSVGYAVTDEQYHLLRHRGEPMWGTTVFEAAKQSADRRGFRTARRRLDRRQQRVRLIRELFATEILKVDENFFTRIMESSLYREDKTSYDFKNVFFNDDNYNDADYYKQYPTIHHLIVELMNSNKPHDVRLVYIACAWLVAHRGHFLSEVSKDNIDAVLLFKPLYESFEAFFTDNSFELPWKCCAEDFENVLKKQVGVTAKEKMFYEIISGGKKPKNDITDTMPFSIAHIIKLLCGGKSKLSELFGNEDYAEIGSVSLSMADEDMLGILSEIGDDSEIIVKLKSLYDWAVLNDVSMNSKSISEAKVKVYEQHHDDLKNLKLFVRKYCPEKYNRIFRKVEKSEHNYVAYSAHTNALSPTEAEEMHKSGKEDFCNYLKKILKDVKCEKADEEFYSDMMHRLSIYTFMPKQVTGDNRVIPYQLYWYELNKILENASGYLPFISETDSEGYVTKDKILSVFEFRIPYYVGPLTDESRSKFAWMKRKANASGKIYPWNFDSIVDKDASEQEFISRMTKSCTYIPGETVLPKNSLLYTSFEVLNEINNLKINGESITVEQKQNIYENLFLKNSKVTPAKLKNFLYSNGIFQKDDVISGIDISASINSNLKPHLDFAQLIAGKTISASQAESIIARRTYSEEQFRYARWVANEFEFLAPSDLKYISRLKYKNFGRLSAKLLNGIIGVCKETGETGSIMYFLWNTNENLMMLLSERYTFMEEIQRLQDSYYSENPKGVEQQFEEMYVSNAVRRPIMRTLDIMDDIVKVNGKAPKKIFVEMARGADENSKKKRTSSRKEQILELYRKVKTEDVRTLSEQLESMGEVADTRLQSDALFLYFMQFGKCMYSGKTIDITKLKTTTYNIDHIYPRCFVKDDSILNNKVLVLSTYNSDKGNTYPINASWQALMKDYWTMLHNCGALNDEKFKRLVRMTPFTNDEKMGFINRQLVETRQSTKALAVILNSVYPDTKIVYVNARLASEFRRKFDLPKSRLINDLHHAKDAYLNIAVGNVYYEKFTRNWFSVTDEYSLNPEYLFTNVQKTREGIVWNGEETLAGVKKNMRKNNIHYTRFAFCRKGGFFDQNPVKASEGLVEMKTGLSTEKYGGYNKTTASFFALVKYFVGEKKSTMIMPVELMAAGKFKNDEAFAQEYAIATIGKIQKKNVDRVEFVLGNRLLKVNTVFEFDGLQMALGSKAGGGKQLGVIPLNPCVLPEEYEKYVFMLEKLSDKIKKNPNIVINSEYDGVCAEQNQKLYAILCGKSAIRPFVLMPNSQTATLENGKCVFIELELKKQVEVLLNIISLYKTGRTGTADLTLIKGSKNSGVLFMSSTVDNWSKNYSDIRIVDKSASGLFESKSVNLIELL